MAVMDDVRALLADAEDVLVQLQDIHAVALHDQSARSVLKAKAKTVVEHERSVLDYLAVAITSKYGTPKGLTYYPLAQNRKSFEADIDSRMPGVRAAEPAIADVIRRYQPYQRDHEWIRDLNQLARGNKHNALGMQIIRNVRFCRVTEDATADYVEWNGARFKPGWIESEGGRIDVCASPDRDPSAPIPWNTTVSSQFHTPLVFGVPIDPATEIPLLDARLTVSHGIQSQWWFYDPHWPVLNGLGFFHHMLRQIAEEIGCIARL